MFRIDPAVERTQIERLAAMRAKRDAAACDAALASVRTVAGEGGNLMPPILAAVEARATLGEISQTLRQVFGTFLETATL